MSCPTCGVAIAADARFCPACGQSISPTESKTGMPAAVEGPNLIGTEIAGGYRILQKLGEGGMGAVYRGEQIALKRAVAIKLLRPELSANETLLHRFRSEATAVAKLSHPNTVNIYDFGQGKDGSLFIAMEFIEGKSLRAVVHAEAPLLPARALHIAAQVAASLADAHSHQIVHRDLKPDNVMLQQRGKQRDIARVLDFGIAKLRDDSRSTQVAALTQAGDLLGTPQYMAPEQVRGEAIDGRTDVYALGCLLYEMTTGRMPFEAPTIMAMLSKHLTEDVVPPSVRRPDLGLPRVIDELVVIAMTKSVAMRPSMENYAEQITRALATMPQLGSNAMPIAAVQTPVAYSAYATPSGAPVATPPHAGQVAPAQPAMTPLQGPPPQNWQPPRRSGKRGLYVVLALATAGAIGGAAYYANRKPSADVAATPSDPWAERKPDPWADKGTQPTPAPAPIPDPLPPIPDPPTPAPTPDDAYFAALGLDTHKAVDVGDGVKLVVPVDFKWARNGGHTTMTGQKLPVMIFAAVITETSDDPNMLAAAYARSTGMTLKGVGTANVAGSPRGSAWFMGMYNGMAVSQAVVAVIGQGYRVAIVLQVPASLTNDAKLLAWGKNYLQHGVILPR